MNINQFRTSKNCLKKERCKKYGIAYGGFKENNMMKYGYDLDMEVYGIWLEAIDLCALRYMYIPKEILDDFYYEHKGKYETEREETKDD